VIILSLIISALAMAVAYFTESETVKCLAVFVAVFLPFVAVFF
jgi:hypothetical protein